MSDDHVSANTSVQVMWGVVAGVKTTGVKCSINLFRRSAQHFASVPETICWVLMMAISDSASGLMVMGPAASLVPWKL